MTQGERGIMIVVAEDDRSTQRLLSVFLDKWGFPHCICGDGQKALEIIQNHPETRRLLTDIMMPLMQGCALVRAVRKIDALHDLPIIIMSGDVHSEEVPDCLSQARVFFHPKPFNWSMLRRQINDLMSLDRL